MQVTDEMVRVEKWRAVKDWPQYEVSNAGTVRSLDRTIRRQDGTAQTFRGRVLSPSLNSKGYLVVTLSDTTNGRRKIARVHRLVAEAFIPNPQNFPEVNHINSIRSDAHVSNLEWVTPSGNRHHGYHHGFITVPYRHGERANSAKLTFKQVAQIRVLAAGGRSSRTLGREFGVDHTTVADLVAGRTWNIPSPPAQEG